MNEQAWDIFMNVEDEAMLNEAVKWAERSIELDKQYANADTYLNLLIKLERWAEAEQAALETIELARKEGVPTADTDTLLYKIRIHIAPQHTAGSVVPDSLTTQ